MQNFNACFRKSSLSNYNCENLTQSCLALTHLSGILQNRWETVGPTVRNLGFTRTRALPASSNPQGDNDRASQDPSLVNHEFYAEKTRPLDINPCVGADKQTQQISLGRGPYLDLHACLDKKRERVQVPDQTTHNTHVLTDRQDPAHGLNESHAKPPIREIVWERGNDTAGKHKAYTIAIMLTLFAGFHTPVKHPGGESSAAAAALANPLLQLAQKQADAAPELRWAAGQPQPNRVVPSSNNCIALKYRTAQVNPLQLTDKVPASCAVHQDSITWQRSESKGKASKGKFASACLPLTGNVTSGLSAQGSRQPAGAWFESSAQQPCYAAAKHHASDSIAKKVVTAICRRAACRVIVCHHILPRGAHYAVEQHSPIPWHNAETTYSKSQQQSDLQGHTYNPTMAKGVHSMKSFWGPVAIALSQLHFVCCLEQEASMVPLTVYLFFTDCVLQQTPRAFMNSVAVLSPVVNVVSTELQQLTVRPAVQNGVWCNYAFFAILQQGAANSMCLYLFFTDDFMLEPPMILLSSETPMSLTGCDFMDMWRTGYAILNNLVTSNDYSVDNSISLSKHALNDISLPTAVHILEGLASKLYTKVNSSIPMILKSVLLGTNILQNVLLNALDHHEYKLLDEYVQIGAVASIANPQIVMIITALLLITVAPQLNTLLSVWMVIRFGMTSLTVLCGTIGMLCDALDIPTTVLTDPMMLISLIPTAAGIYIMLTLLTKPTKQYTNDNTKHRRLVLLCRGTNITIPLRMVTIQEPNMEQPFCTYAYLNKTVLGHKLVLNKVQPVLLVTKKKHAHHHNLKPHKLPRILIGEGHPWSPKAYVRYKPRSDILLALLMSGNVHPNPGPPTVYNHMETAMIEYEAIMREHNITDDSPIQWLTLNKVDELAFPQTHLSTSPEIITNIAEMDITGIPYNIPTPIRLGIHLKCRDKVYHTPLTPILISRSGTPSGIPELELRVLSHIAKHSEHYHKIYNHNPIQIIHRMIREHSSPNIDTELADKWIHDMLLRALTHVLHCRVFDWRVDDAVTRIYTPPGDTQSPRGLNTDVHVLSFQTIDMRVHLPLTRQPEYSTMIIHHLPNIRLTELGSTRPNQVLDPAHEQHSRELAKLATAFLKYQAKKAAPPKPKRKTGVELHHNIKQFCTQETHARNTVEQDTTMDRTADIALILTKLQPKNATPTGQCIRQCGQTTGKTVKCAAPECTNQIHYKCGGKPKTTWFCPTHGVMYGLSGLDPHNIFGPEGHWEHCSECGLPACVNKKLHLCEHPGCNEAFHYSCLKRRVPRYATTRYDSRKQYYCKHHVKYHGAPLLDYMFTMQTNLDGPSNADEQELRQVINSCHARTQWSKGTLPQYKHTFIHSIFLLLGDEVTPAQVMDAATAAGIHTAVQLDNLAKAVFLTHPELLPYREHNSQPASTKHDTNDQPMEQPTNTTRPKTGKVQTTLFPTRTEREGNDKPDKTPPAQLTQLWPEHEQVTFATWNIAGVWRHDEIHELIQARRPHILALTETKFAAKLSGKMIARIKYTLQEYQTYKSSTQPDPEADPKEE